MPPEALERKLTAILSADVAGYSLIMREDTYFLDATPKRQATPENSKTGERDEKKTIW